MPSKFFDELPDLDKLPKVSKTRPAKAKHVEVLTNERGCNVCPLKNTWGTISTPKMPATGKQNADILVLGGQPTEEDDLAGEQFKSPGGLLFRKAIPSRHVSRFRFQNVVRCQSFNKPGAQAIHACSEHLEKDMHGIKAIIGVGQIPLSKFFPDAQIAQVWMIHGLRMVVTIGNKNYWYLPVNDMQEYLEQKRNRNPEYDAEFSVLKAEIKVFLSIVDTLAKPKIYKFDRACVQTPDSKEEALALIKTMSEPIGLDLESTRLKPYERGARLLTAAFSDDKTTIAIPCTKWGLEVLEYVVTNYSWVAHHAPMELLWLRFTFPEAKLMPFEDSRACVRLYFQRANSTGLAPATRIVLGENVKELSDLVVTRLEEYPIEEVLVYNGLDALACRLVWQKVRPKIHTGNYNRLIDTVESIVEMELTGLEIDYDKVDELRALWRAKVYEAEKKASEIFEVKAWQMSRGREFKMTNAELGDVLVNFAHIQLPKTASGSYQTDEQTLQNYASGHPLGQAVLAYREAEKQIATYIDACGRAKNHYEDQRIHPGYDPYNVVTTRLSSDDPNITNFPKRRHREIRGMVIPDKKRGLIIIKKKHVFVPIDFGQLEARLIAMISRDRAFCEATIKGVDVHSKWLMRLLDLAPTYIDYLKRKTNETEEKKIIKGGRSIIKTDFVFASFYGATPKTCATRTGVDLDIMMQLANELWSEYKGVKRWIEAQRTNYGNTGEIATATGIIRHAVVSGNEVINNPIQGTAACIVMDAMNELSKLSRARKDPYLHPRIYIHDDLTFCLPAQDSKLEAYMLEIAEIMVKIRYDFQIVPFMVECSIAENNWAETTPIWEYTGDYIR